MFEKSPYAALPSEERTESKETLLNDLPSFRSENRTKLQKQLHWTFHCISSFTIIALSFGLYFALQTSRTVCWDKFNYYCKTT